MSDPSTTPPEAAKAEGSEPAAAGAATEASSSFEEVRKKLAEQISELGHHVDGLQQKLTDAAGQARQLIEKELANLKTQHPEAFARLEELRHSGDESLDVLRGRLDKLAGDLEKAVSGFLGTLADQAKRATGKVTPAADTAPSTSPDPAQSQTPAAPPAEENKPQS
jgi:TolA-binding protein